MIEQIGDNIVDINGHTLLDQAFLTNHPKVIEFLLTVAKDPQELLARFPFELANPTSDIFKYFMEVAYDAPDWLLSGTAQLGTKCAPSDSSPLTLEQLSTAKSCGYCSSDFASTSPRLLGAAKATPDLDSSPLEQLSTANSCAYCSQENCVARCSICKSVYYCSTDCQKKHWATHKHHCKAHS